MTIRRSPTMNDNGVLALVVLTSTPSQRHVHLLFANLRGELALPDRLSRSVTGTSRTSASSSGWAVVTTFPTRVEGREQGADRTETRFSRTRQ